MAKDLNRYYHMGGNRIVMLPLPRQGLVSAPATQVIVAINFYPYGAL